MFVVPFRNALLNVCPPLTHMELMVDSTRTPASAFLGTPGAACAPCLETGNQNQPQKLQKCDPQRTVHWIIAKGEVNQESSRPRLNLHGECVSLRIGWSIEVHNLAVSRATEFSLQGVNRPKSPCQQI